MQADRIVEERDLEGEKLRLLSFSSGGQLESSDLPSPPSSFIFVEKHLKPLLGYPRNTAAGNGLQCMDCVCLTWFADADFQKLLSQHH